MGATDVLSPPAATADPFADLIPEQGADPFADLIPQQAAPAFNPFADLIPSANVQAPANPFADLVPGGQGALLNNPNTPDSQLPTANESPGHGQEITETPTVMGELGQGNLGHAAGLAYENTRRLFSGLIGPTESERVANSVPVTDAAGNTTYQYKPAGNRMDQEAGLFTPFLKVEPLQPSKDDSPLVGTGKALFNIASGVEGSLLSPGGIATAGSSGAAAKAIGGAFTLDMASSAKEQIQSGLSSDTVQGKIQGLLGGAVTLGMAALGAKHMASSGPTTGEIVQHIDKVPDEILKQAAASPEFAKASPEIAHAATDELQKRAAAAPTPEAQPIAPEAKAAVEATPGASDATSPPTPESATPEIAPLTKEAADQSTLSVSQLASRALENAVPKSESGIFEKMALSHAFMSGADSDFLHTDSGQFLQDHGYLDDAGNLTDLGHAQFEMNNGVSTDAVADALRGKGAPEANDWAASHGLTMNGKITDSGKAALTRWLNDARPDGYTGGPGAMGPKEAAGMEANAADNTTSLKRAVVDLQRSADGREDIPVETRADSAQKISDAEDAVTANPEIGKQLVDRINSSGVSEQKVSPQEAAVLLVERTRLRTERDAWEERAGDKNSTKEERDMARLTADDLDSQIDQVDQASRKAGTAWSDFGRLYQQNLREDFTVDALERKAKAKAGRPLEPDERAALAKQAKEYKDLQDHAAQLEKAAQEGQQHAETARILQKMVGDTQKELAARPYIPKPVLEIARGVVDRWKADAELAHQSLRARLKNTSAGVDPSIVLDVARIMRGHIGEIGLKAAEVAARVVSDFGEEVRPYLKDAWAKARRMVNDEKIPPRSKAQIEKTGAPREETMVDAKAKAKADAVAGEGLTPTTVANVVREHIKAGVHGEDALMKATHETLKESHPDISERDVRRALTDYGHATFPSKEAVDVELRETKSLVRMQESIDRLKEGQDPLHTGPQREKATQLIREKTAELNEALKKREGPPSPEKLASRDEAKQTALKNAIEDLDKQLRTGEKPIKGEPAPDSAKTQQLRAERDAMRAKLKEIQDAATPKPSAEQIAADKAQQGVDRAAAALDRQQRINSGEIKPEAQEKAQPLSALEKELRDRTEELKKAKRAAEAKSEADKQVEQLAKNRDRISDVLSGKRDPTKPKDFNPLSTEAENIKAEIQAMHELAAQMRRDAKPKSDPGYAKEQAQIKALERSIKNYEAKTAAGDFAAKGKVHGPDSADVAKLKAIRDARAEAYKSAKDAGKPILTPDEKYNATRMQRIQKQMTELQRRLDTKDFAPVVKTPKEKFAATAKAEADLAAKRQEIKQSIEHIRMANRSIPQRGFDMVKHALNLITSVKVLGHGTVGMITHAGGLMYRPSTFGIWARNFGRQFPMWVNKSFHGQLIYKLKNDPQYAMWKKAGASIDPEHVYTDYGMYAKWMGKLGAGGARGFDALKLTRLELNKADWAKVPDSIKSDPQAALETQRRIAEINNKATGAIPKGGGALEDLARNGIVNQGLFAPRLYASRFARVVLDPVKTAFTFLDWNAASQADRFAATTRLKHAAEFTAGYVAALALNQALLKAAGSNQSVNMGDPTKSDWLKFKAGGKEIVADGGLLDPVRLLGQIVIGDLMQNRTASQQFREGTRYEKAGHDLMKYGRSKLTPTAGFLADAATGSDFQGRPLPFSNEKPKYKDQTKYSWSEWLSQQGPIPLAGGSKIAYDAMRQKGMTHIQAMDILKGAAVSFLGMTGAHAGTDYSAK